MITYTYFTLIIITWLSYILYFSMPQTPLRIIQKYNNFAHSTYTPPQSLEDLTKIDSLTEELSSRSGKPSLPPASKPTAGTDVLNETVNKNFRKVLLFI